jgi:kynurenine 3-monooxygenase
MERRHVTLVGAGLAGSLLAVYLGRRGHRVTVLEKRPDLRRTDISAGRSINLALANRGIKALREVDVMPAVEPLLIPMSGRMLHDEQGALQLVPYGNKPHEVIYSVSRGGLNAILLDAAEATGNVEIRFLHPCRSVDLGAGRIIIETPDGREAELGFDVLIGTDGSASPVRDAILSVTSGEFRSEPLGHSYKELTIQPDDGGGFRMEPRALHIWPRGEFMLIALPNPDHSFTLTLFMPNKGDESFATLTEATAIERFFGKYFADATALMPDFVEQFFANPTGHLETIRCRPWNHGRAVILGDAAHAIVPFHGQGMNCAFEDCSDLAHRLDEGEDWEAAFGRFAEARKPNADAIADMAIENYTEMRATVRDALFQLHKEIGFRLEELHPDRFIPRYSMVMFHTLPYAEAKRRGIVQKEILNTLTSGGAVSLGDIDMKLASRLIGDRLGPVTPDR